MVVMFKTGSKIQSRVIDAILTLVSTFLALYLFLNLTHLFWELAFSSVGGITSKKCLSILRFSDKLLSEFSLALALSCLVVTKRPHIYV